MIVDELSRRKCLTTGIIVHQARAFGPFLSFSLASVVVMRNMTSNTVRKLFLNVNREICNTMLMSFFVHVMADNRWTRVAMSSEVLFCRKEILKSIASSTLSALQSLLFTRTGGISS
jgi:hypothetical protein